MMIIMIMPPILKSKFYYFSGLRPVDQEMTAIEPAVRYAGFPKGGGTSYPTGPRREALGSVRRQREPEANRQMWGRAFIVVSLGRGG